MIRAASGPTRPRGARIANPPLPRRVQGHVSATSRRWADAPAGADRQPRHPGARVHGSRGASGGPTAGERWAAHALAEVRTARFSPGATAAFLAASFARAAENRGGRPRLALQARRWSAAGAGIALTARSALARREAAVPRRGTLIAWLAFEALMLDWHLGMIEGLGGEPRAALSAADALTLARGALAPFAAAAPPSAPLFLSLLAFGGASDLLDGRLARRAGPTRFGRDFDTLADLAFRGAAVHGARRAAWLDASAARALAARQLLLVSGAAWHWLARSQRPPHDPGRVARWDAPPLLLGLACGSLGMPAAGAACVKVAAVVGALGLLRAGIADHPPAAAGSGDQPVAPASCRASIR